MKSPTRPTLEKLEDRLVPSMTPAQQAIYDHVAQSHTAAVAALDAQEDTYQGELTAIVAQLENLQEQMSTLDAYDNVLAAVKDLDARIAALPEVTTPQWQTNSRTQLQGIEGIPLRPFVRFAPSPDGTQVLAIRDNGSVSIFDTRTGQQVRGLETGMTNATSIEWSPNGQSFAVSGKMGGAWKIQIHNATNGGVLLEKNFGSTGVADVEFSPDGTRVSVVMSTGTSAIYEVATGVEKMRTAVSSVGTYSAAYSKDGTELYADVHTSATSGYIAAYDTATGALKRKYEGMGGSITGISVSPDGKYLLAGSSNGQVNIYNAQTGVLVTAVSGTDSGRADSVQWNDAGNAFAVARSLTTSDKTGVKVYSFSNGSIQQVFSKQYPDGAETIKLRFLPGSHTLLIQETTWAYGESFYSSISAMAVPESVRPATRDALVQTRDALLNVLPDEKDTTQEIADARDDLLSGMTQLAESLQTTADDLAQAQAQEAAVDAFFSDYATQIATVLTGSVSIGATELMATAGAAEQADTAVLEAQDALWHALTGGADDAQLAEAADALAQSLSQRAAAYGTLTPATLTSPAPAGVDLLSLAGARGADALKSALLGGAGTLSHTVFTRSIAILSKTTEGPWDAKELWQARVSAVTGQNAVAAQTALDQLTASLTIRERNAAINQIVTRPLVRPSERQALLQTLTPQARQTAAEFQQAYRLSGLTSGSRNETGDMAIRFYSTALDINLEIRPNGDVYSHNERRVIVTLDPLFHSRPELLETLVPNDGLDALAAEHGYGVRETYAAGILVSQLGAVRMTLGSPNNDRVREGEFLNAQGVPVARVYVENGTGFVQYMNRTLLSGLSAAALADMDAFLAAGREATAMIASTGLLPERALLVPQSTIVQAAAFATQYGLELKGNSVYGNALGFGEDSAWSATLNTWIVWKDGKMMTEQELLNSMRNPSYQPQILATFNTTLGGMAMVVGARERLNDQDILASLPPQARMQMRMLTAESGAMLDLRQNNGATIATDILTQQSWAWDITSNSWRDLSVQSSDTSLSASVSVTERPLEWSPSFNRTFAESALSTLGLTLPSVRDFAIRMNSMLFGRTQDDDLAALRRNAFLFTGEWSGPEYASRYQSLVQSRSDTMQRAQQEYTKEYDKLLTAIRAAYGSEEARRAGEQGSDAWKGTVPLSLTTAAAIAEGVSNNFYRLYQTVLDLNHSTRALVAGANRETEANAYDAKIIRQFEQSVLYIRDNADAYNTPFSTRIARLILNTDPGVLQKYFAGTAVVGSSLDTLTPNLQKTFVAVYSTEAGVDQRVAAIWGNVGSTYLVAMGNGLEAQIQQNDGWLATAEEVSGIGGAQHELNEQRAQLAGQTLEQAKAHLLSLYQDSNTQEYPMIGGQYVRDDTIAGRIFHGLYQKGFSMNDADFKKALVEAEQVLGVRASYLWYRGRDRDFQKFQQGLVSEFTRSGVGHIFLGADSAKKIVRSVSQPEIASLTFDKTSYGAEDDVIRMTFDIALPTSMQNFSSVRQRVYLMNGFTGEQLPGDGVGVVFVDANTIEISTRAIVEKIGGGNAFSGLLSFKLALWPTDDVSLPGLQGKNVSGSVQVELKKRSGLSTNPDANLQKKEDEVLALIGSRLPVRLTEGTWTASLGSPYHDDEHGHAFNALDINLSTNDRDSELLAVANGRISRIDLTYGTIVIDHAANGDIPDWQSKYLHTPLVKTGRTVTLTVNGQEVQRDIYAFKKADGKLSDIEIWVGKEIKTGNRIGIIAGRGPSSENDAGNDEDGTAISDIVFGSHLHFEILIGGRSINIGRLVTDTWKLQVDDGGLKETPLHWSSDVDIGNQGGAWVNDEQKVIYFRDPNTSTDLQTDYWIAWEAGKTVDQMTKITWQSVGRNASGVEQFAWVSVDLVNGVTSVWRKKDNQFGFISLAAYKAENSLL